MSHSDICRPPSAREIEAWVEAEQAAQEAAMTEREFLGLDDVIAKATERTKAAEVAANMLVTLYRTGITPHPSKFAELREAVEGWEKAR